MPSARAATPDDYGLFTRFYAAFDAPGPVPTREWWERSHGDALFIHASDESDVVVGYGFAYRVGAELGHVGHVVVEEKHRGRGFGHVVMHAIRERLRGLGCARWSLYVMHDNVPALALYRRCGMTVTSPVDEIAMSSLAARTLPSDIAIVVEPLAEEGDAAIERTFALPTGRLGRVRRIPGRSFFVARIAGRVAGTVAFEPTSRSAPILCAEAPAVARALITAVAGEGDVRLFVNGDPALSGALERAGGRVVRRLLQMEGSLLA